MIKNSENNNILFIKARNGKKTNYISIDDIIYFKSESNYTRFVITSGDSFVTSKTLKIYHQLLSNTQHFCRIHDSYLVNMKLVINIKRNKEVELINGLFLPISSRKKSDVDAYCI